MIQINIDIDGIDYEKAVPVIVPLIISNPIAAKAAQLALLTKFKNKSQSERNAMFVNFINEHKNKIIKTCNEKVNENGTLGYLCNVSADMI